MASAPLRQSVDEFCKKTGGQVVLVLQGGGALGAYQVGVYQALHEAGIEPDWIIGTSIGAINAGLIAGNRPADRLAKLDAFWNKMARGSAGRTGGWPGLAELWTSWSILARSEERRVGKECRSRWSPYH